MLKLNAKTRNAKTQYAKTRNPKTPKSDRITMEKSIFFAKKLWKKVCFSAHNTMETMEKSF